MSRMGFVMVMALAIPASACGGGDGTGTLLRSDPASSSQPEWQKDPGLLGVRWQRTVGGHLDLLGAAIDSDRVYVAGKDNVVALAVESGDELWQADTDDLLEPPVVIEDRVIVVTEDGRLIALDTGTGDQAWAADATSTSTVHGSGVSVASGTPVAIDFDGVFAVDPADGRQVWRTASPPHPAPGFEGPVLADANRVFVHTAEPTELVALDARTGGEVWRTPIRASRTNPSLYAAGGLVFQAESGGSDDRPIQLVAIDADSGKARWEIALPAPVLDPPVVLDDTVVFSTGKGVHALAIADGSRRFAIHDDLQYPDIAPCGRELCVNAVSLELVGANGRVAQNIDPPEVSILPPASHLNVIVYLDAEGTVYRYR